MISNMKIKVLILALSALTSALQVNAFCGFYVAKADAKLFNNKSEVILARNGDETIVTMSNDFKGDVKDFAMVVPVPVVLRKDEIKTVSQHLFTKMNEYSAPRLVEYYDENPCQPAIVEEVLEVARVATMDFIESDMAFSAPMNEYKVTIEAQYEVGEYDILILSAKESNGLKRWLIDNDYKIPNDAEEVLEPYIKSKMNFFVVKVNLDRMPVANNGFLSPLQLRYKSDRFMLPIRLGMANAENNQDLIVYCLTDQGRVECTNYRTVKMPTDRNIPLFVQPKFGDFYKSTFEKKWKNEGQNAVMLEYAWDVSPVASVKCDPCVGPPPVDQDLVNAGVNWIGNNGRGGKVYFTRLHVRYDREHFPQDLFFQVTPNTDRFQCRYILTHPARGDMRCDAGQKYLEDLEMRRKREVEELAALTSWGVDYKDSYINEFSNRKIQTFDTDEDGVKKNGIGSLPWTLPVTFLLMAGLFSISKRLRKAE